MLLVRTFIRSSLVHGLGLFAAEPIVEGQRIWKFDLLIDRVLDPREIELQPKDVREFVHAHAFVDWYGNVVLSADQAIYMNHGADGANVLADGIGSYAARPIEAGEELLEDYRQFGRGYCNEFLFGAAA